MGDPHHATCVAIGQAGILLIGRSGSGKSDLALRLIDRGAVLVSDDYTRLDATDAGLVATAPATIAGRMEVREVGILPFATLPRAIVRLAIELVRETPRLPEPATIEFGGMTIPLLRLDPRPASAAIKVELALARLVHAAP